MAELSSCVEMLLENGEEMLHDAVDTLLKIAGNILRDPGNDKYRSLNLSSAVVARRLLPAVGALEVLFLMGFEEADDKLVLPRENSLENVRRFQGELQTLKSTRMKGRTVKQATVQAATALTPEVQKMEGDFEAELAREFERVLVYESSGLQDKARQVLPVQDLHDKARKRLQVVNSAASAGEDKLEFQDCVLVELLSWFKNEFFQWFNAPSCAQCSTPMAAAQPLQPTAEDLTWGGQRVEGYTCKTCGAKDRFVRYNHPGKLLETRKGRCGEWANCFTLLCRTLGMDARYVHDYTDHVWTEVYSQSQRRWLHADPCENKMDAPLMYERGWAKKLNYVIAYSKDELVDVTWRYTSKQQEVLKRRRRCREGWLVATVLDMNRRRQAVFPEAKRRFLEHRMVAEVAEFFALKNDTKDSEKEGRSSGSLAWRLARGETHTPAGHTFTPTAQEVARGEFVVKYSAARDEYVRGGEVVKGWQAGVREASGVFRKHEADWKMVYLARIEGSSEGEVKWEVDLSGCGVAAKSLLVVLQHATFETGRVAWQVCTGDKCFNGNKEGVVEVKGEELAGVKKVVVEARLEGGDTDGLGWQHAQLFRQSDSATDQFPFLLHVRFS